MADAHVYASLQGGNEVILRLENVKRATETGLSHTVRKIGDDAEIIFGAHTLKDTGRLTRGIRSVPTGSLSARVVAHAREPKSGYDYVGVTRFGHGQARIHGHPILGGRNARTTVKYPNFLARSVRGFHPSQDWRDKALPTIEREAEMAMRQLAREIETAF